MIDVLTSGLLTKLGEKAAEAIARRVSEDRHLDEVVEFAIKSPKPRGSGIEFYLAVERSRKRVLIKSVKAEGWWLSEFNPNTRGASRGN